MKSFLFILLAAVFSANAIAECIVGSCTGVKITRMYVTADGGTIISTSGDESKLSCDAGNSGYINLDILAKNYNATYSLLLTAHTTGHPVWVRTTESGQCQVIYVVSDK